MSNVQQQGAELNASVARIEGLWIDGIRGGECIVGLTPDRFVYAPSVNWAQGGPIIERERISTQFVDGAGTFMGELVTGPRWLARYGGGYNKIGPTLLIAAMRAFVAAKQEQPR